MDDVTGKPLPPTGWAALSSAQRSEQMDVLIQQIVALTDHANKCARAVAELQAAAKGHELRIMGLEARVEALYAPRPWWARLMGR
jgi:hypothetical protein